jgi:hypothetical protein
MNLQVAQNYKNKTMAEYALKDTTKPIGVSTYRLSEKLREALKAFLPSGEEMAGRLEIFNDD